MEIIDDHLTGKEQEYVFKIRPVIIWSVLLMIGANFEIMNWPGGAVLVIVFSAGLTAYSFSGLLESKGRNWFNNLLCMLGFFWFGIIVWGVFFNYGYPYNKNGLVGYCVAFTVFFLINEFLKRTVIKLKKKKRFVKK